MKEFLLFLMVCKSFQLSINGDFVKRCSIADVLSQLYRKSDFGNMTEKEFKTFLKETKDKGYIYVDCDTVIKWSLY